VDGRIELFHVDDIPGNGFGVARVLRVSGLRALVPQALHAVEDKAPGFVAHHGALDAGLPTALCGGVTEEDKRSNDLVIVLDGIDKV